MERRDPATSARRGLFSTDHGDIETPVFIPIGTYGAVKTLAPRDLESAGASIVLGNAYHLYLRPGMEIIQKAAGLHAFMAWDRSIVTDSGGFQVFSLAELREISADGVTFKSTLNGSVHEMTPEKSMEIQRVLGSDIIMSLDVCPPGDAPLEEIARAVSLTTTWANRCFDYLKQTSESYGKRDTFFPIVQGGIQKELRQQSTEELLPLANIGVAVGGLAVGEEKSAMFDTVSLMDHLLPRDKIRYLMGVGKPQDIVRAVRLGMDMFDCVIPTRNARNGQLFTWNGTINVLNEKYKLDFSPVDETCACHGCRTFSRAYLRHLYNLNEILGLHLGSLHNVTFYLDLMSRIRKEIQEGTYLSWSRQFLAKVRETTHD
ncbi:MAG: tRNA guanosine(34) transglycosylase Tgt [Candidatus Neomarinimicrobiota bacterium]